MSFDVTTSCVYFLVFTNAGYEIGGELVERRRDFSARRDKIYSIYDGDVLYVGKHIFIHCATRTFNYYYCNNKRPWHNLLSRINLRRNKGA